jgi:DNA end-binding protein Ku
MPRPLWSGSINFGLVAIPVDLYSATSDHTVHFRQFERGTEDRIRYRRVNERTGKEVDFANIVKGYEVSRNDYVILEPEELDEIAPGRSKTIDIATFVDLGDIDPLFFQKSYWLVPTKEEFHHAYALLVHAMTETDKAGISTFVMRGKEYLAAIRAGDGLLVLNTLHFAEDMRDPARELPEIPQLPRLRGKELNMAIQLIDSMSEEWKPEDYEDTFTKRVEELVKNKKHGKVTDPETEPAEPTKVIDLFDALSRSIKGDKRQRRNLRANEKTQTVDLDELTKSELDKIARDLDIKGRSKMARAELTKAINQVNSTKQKAS